MRLEGHGGRGSTIRDDPGLLDGLTDTKIYGVLPDKQECANPKCGHPFRPRSDGDLYCTAACDLDSNPQYGGSR